MRDLLRRERLRTQERYLLLRALQELWCYPVRPEDVALLEGFAARHGIRVSPPSPLRPGEVCLVSVSSQEARGALSRLGPEVPPPPRAVELARGARDVLRTSARVAWRDLQFLRCAGEIDRRHDFGAELVWREGGGDEPTLDGASFGLSMCLAHASLALDLPVPPDLCASAEVELDGRLRVVDGLDVKLRVVTNAALGVRRFLVAAPQVPEAKEIAARLGDAAPEILDAATVTEAFGKVWKDVDVGALWRDDADAAACASELFYLTLDTRIPFIGWRAVELATSKILERDGVDELARFHASAAREISRRHQSILAPLQWPSGPHFDRLSRPRRIAYVAHVVQSGADSSDEHARQHVARALGRERPGEVEDGAILAAAVVTGSGWLPPRSERHPEDLRLLGAIGRALAATGSYAGAEVCLRAAAEEWLDHGLDEEASYSLSEYLRVLGVELALDSSDPPAKSLPSRPVAATHGEIERALREWVERVMDHPRTTDESRGYLALAAGRALVQAGDADGALAWIGDDANLDWALFSGDLHAARSRWLARALRARGRHDEADRLSPVPTSVPDQPPSDQQLLAAIDRALSLGEDAAAELKTLGQITAAPDPKGHWVDFRRLLARLGCPSPGKEPREFARRVAEEYRY